MLDDARIHFSSIEQALVMVDGDEFGVCVGCGERIPFARLDARPYARYCVGCAERVER